MNQSTTAAQCIILCPGQGAQHVGMGRKWLDRYPVAKQTFAQADEVLGFELSKICFEGPANQLDRTDISQAAIYATSIACFRALAESGQVLPAGAIAGLSLGEFTALHLAGAFDFVTGLRLVRLRGQAMQAAAEAAPGGMVALIGADEQQAQKLCEQARGTVGTDVLTPANFNCPGQIVISGSRDACQRALAMAGDMGLRATPLKVAGAFHSPLMLPAAKRLAAALDEAQWKTPAPGVLVVSNVTAKPHDTGDIRSIKKLLVDQLTNPVRWAESVAWLIANCRGEFVELAPGSVLAGLMRRIDRNVKASNFADPPA